MNILSSWEVVWRKHSVPLYAWPNTIKHFSPIQLNASALGTHWLLMLYRNIGSALPTNQKSWQRSNNWATSVIRGGEHEEDFYAVSQSWAKKKPPELWRDSWRIPFTKSRGWLKMPRLLSLRWDRSHWKFRRTRLRVSAPRKPPRIVNWLFMWYNLPRVCATQMHTKHKTKQTNKNPNQKTHPQFFAQIDNE